MRNIRLYQKSCVLLIQIIGILVVTGCGEQIDAPPSHATAPESPWIMSDTHDIGGAELFASCASCHMADGSGRNDGRIPKLAGQNKQILIHKLQKLRNDEVDLPVMKPFASALSESQLQQIARYLSTLPSGLNSQTQLSDSESTKQTSSNHHYTTFCAVCHGQSGEGNAHLLAPTLCHQHASYLSRRLSEIEQNSRGDADTGMMAVLSTMNANIRNEISQWLASGQCQNQSHMENNHES